MTRRILLALLALGLLGGVGAARADEGAAPALEGVQWIARGPAKQDVPEELLVVEIWATWCGPCHATFPVLTELQAAHADRIRVVALSDEPPDRVRRFFQAHREVMRIGVGAASEAVVQGFLFGGFTGRGIPSVYVIRGGRVVWSGAPDGVKAAVDGLLAPEEEPAE